ncbi:hypothetical protein [Massilibacteroides sp.]|uniref:hypothetical protein n=1 Tax=Massilibacteroides sp. TaxID=2034766 RepID=UPI00262A32E7|nr:hypothetical protein [Massilibacteroides sp.]MDD4514562.1 hypothetical protein [Massilibacteroides sp.]
MKILRAEIITLLLVVASIIGAIVFFFSFVGKEQKKEKTDLFDLLLPEPKSVLLINQPAEFISMLKRQPQLYLYFKEILPEDCYTFLACKKNSPVLLAFYAQGIMFYSYSVGGDAVWLKHSAFTTVKKEGIPLRFYPKTANQYLGFYQYNDVFVGSYSRKLLETTVSLQKRGIKDSPVYLKELRRNIDKDALLNVFFYQEPESDWKALDVFLHESQVCCLLNSPNKQLPDSLLKVAGDSLSTRITALIPELQPQIGISKDDSIIYFTLCVPLFSNDNEK